MHRGNGYARLAEVWTGASLSGGTIGALTRIRVAPGTADMVYVLGYGAYGFVEGNDQPFVLRSSNGGLTWAESWIQEDLPETTGYTVSHKSDTQVLSTVSWPFWNYYGKTFFEFARIGDDEPGQTVNPWAIAYKVTTSTSGLSTTSARTVDDDDADQLYNNLPSMQLDIVFGSGNYLLGVNLPDGKAILDDYFGSGGWTEWTGSGYNFALDEDKTRFYYEFASQLHSSAPSLSCTFEVWVFWNKPDISEPTALDVARTNSSWVYVGTPGKVWKSIDGGFTWAESLDDHGSNDICVDPQLAGVYYHWAADGSLELVVADAVSGSDLDTETPAEVGLRLARDLNSGRLWALESRPR